MLSYVCPIKKDKAMMTGSLMNRLMENRSSVKKIEVGTEKRGSKMKKEDIALAKAIDEAMARTGLIQQKAKPVSHRIGWFFNHSGKELTSNFVRFANIAAADGFNVTAVKETYENVYCTLNDFKVQFPKCTKDVKGFYRFIKSNYEMNQKARVTK